MNIKIDSRKVLPGDIFVALDNGHKYIEDALNKGASKIITEKKYSGKNIKKVRSPKNFLIKYLKKNYYNAIKDIKLIGITGTNGKTTSAFLTYQALNYADIKAAYIGTIGFYIDGKKCDLGNTTPEVLDLYNMIIEAKESNCKVVVMEVSSHSLSFKRVNSLKFDYAIFTNLTEDHLDYHKDMNKYFKAKKKLFKMLRKGGKAIINIDDEYGKRIKSKNRITISKNKATYVIGKYSIKSKTRFYINDSKYEMNLLGLYNIYNMTNTIIILNEFKIQKIEKIIKKLVSPPGRMEIIEYGNNKIIVDYAHTPDAMENIIKCVKEFATSNIYVIIGCGGNRDKKKRPIMANVAINMAHYTIFTSDNPRTEDPIKILDDMTKELEKTNYEVIVNRSEAIRKGVQLLKNHDILLLLGKGHETYQILGENKIYFNDKEEVLKYIRR